MDDVKLPDLSRVRGDKKAFKKLPPQKSATDTSNWENRDFSAPTIVTERHFDFVLNEQKQMVNPYLSQEARKAKYPTKDSAD